MCRVWEGFLVQYVVTAVCSFALRAYGVAGGSLNGAYSCCEERIHFWDLRRAVLGQATSCLVTQARFVMEGRSRSSSGDEKR
jgi:hypothetical protein